MAKMNPGMKMLAMAKVTRPDGERMGDDRGMRMGSYDTMPEMRRRRDKKGRYMEGDDEPYMGIPRENRDEPMGRYYPGGMPPISPGMRAGDYPSHAGNRDADRRPYRHMEGVDGRRNEGDESPHMGGWGGFVWDSMDDGRRSMRDDDGEDDSQRMQRPGWPWGENERSGNITSMHDYAQGKDNQGQRMIGFQQGKTHKEKGQHLTKEEAEEWVDQMRTKDGRPGKRWSYDEIRQYAGNYGVTGEQKVIDFFVVLNMMYSDYCHVAKKLGVDNMEFYAGMAKSFMDDPDAAEGKLVKYREYIAKDEE